MEVCTFIYMRIGVTETSIDLESIYIVIMHVVIKQHRYILV